MYQSFPPKDGVFTMFVGVLCCYLVWIRVKDHLGTALDLVLLILSLMLMAYGFFVLLSWSAS